MPGQGVPRVRVRTPAVLALVGVLLAALAPTASYAVVPAVETIVPYEATGYRFEVVAQGAGAGFEQAGFDDSAFSDGAAAFGEAGGCANDEAITTPWPHLTDLLVRRTIAVPDDGRQLHLGISAVDQVQVFVNGVDVTGGLVDAAPDTCPRREDLHLIVPEAALDRGADNLLAVRGRAGSGSSFLDLTAMLAPVPVNDDLADATAIASLPFSDQTSVMAASLESGESAQSCPGGIETDCQTIWYAFTPPTTDSFMLDAFTGPANDMPTSAGIAVYTGSGFGDLSTVVARPSWDWRPLLFTGEAGATYLLQVTGHLPLDYSGPSLTVSLSIAPDPTVSFEVPTDPISTADQLMVWAFFDDPASQEVATYHWDFGDGATSAEPVGQHYYTAAGTYGITLTVTMVDGRSGSDSHSVTVTKFEGPDPIAGFDWAPTTPDTQTDIQFTSTSSDPALVGIAAWAWTFDDGGSAAGERASHRFDTAGDHSVGLQVTTHDGRAATIAQTVTVGEYVPPDPVASFGFWPTEPFAGQVVQFFDLSSDPASIGVTDWVWDFGDGATGSGPSPSHGFAAVGTFTVGLTVTTADGRTGSTSQSITTTATPPPTAMFVSHPSDPTIHDTVQFSDVSWDPAGLGITAWDWDLGDGSTADTSFVGHRYDADGDYTVSLTVETPDGRISTTSQEVQVRTHDVAITDVESPSSAKADRTKTVSIYLVSRRRTESVTVQLLRSTTAGYDVVDQRSVTMHRGVRQRVTFDYRFTADDARLGWVSFKAIASIDGLRDALPGDNEAISPPVKVVR